LAPQSHGVHLTDGLQKPPTCNPVESAKCHTEVYLASVFVTDVARTGNEENLRHRYSTCSECFRLNVPAHRNERGYLRTSSKTVSIATLHQPRPPLWPAGMAEGNRETFGPRVGLPPHGAPAKGGPKSKYLARLKIARTSAGPPSLTISDPSRFPSRPSRFPLPASTGPPSLTISDLSRFPLPQWPACTAVDLNR